MSGQSFAPFFVRLKRSGDRWQLFAGRPSAEPLDTVQFVIEVPEFLGAAFPERPLTRAAMVAPGGESNRVLVVVDEAGGVLLAGCPEPGGAQALVGELVAAGAKLWNRKGEELAGRFGEFLGMSLQDWIAARVRAGWSADRFKSGLDASLAQGKFGLVMVASEGDDGVGAAIAYLQGMNLDARRLGYDYLVDAGDELVRARPALPARPETAATTPTPRPEQKPEPQGPAVSQRVEVNQHVPTATVGTAQPVKPFEGMTRTYEPWPASNATPEQLEILERLLPLAELGLTRRGFEFFMTRATGDAVGGTIVVAIDAERWPFPKPDQVVVVVNTGSDHLAGHLRIQPAEVEEFLASLPRVAEKERKGSLLLRAANTHEATQLVNELRALREVSSGG